MKNFLRKTALAVATVLALGAASQTSQAAQILYGVTGASGSASSLYQIDATTGAATLIGATGFTHVVSIDIHPVTGVIYGISNSFGGTNALITIDATTGAGTFVANVGGDNWPDITFDSRGTLYSWSEASPDRLNTIDLTTGATTEIGPNGLNTYQFGLGADSADTIYAKNGDGNVYTIDKTTGAATFVVSLGSGGLDNALAFDENDVAFTLDRFGSETSLLTLDLMTGAVTTIGATGIANLGAIAFSNAVSVSGPAVLMLFGLGLAGLGMMRRNPRA